jgi:predicted transcriptional regulator
MKKQTLGVQELALLRYVAERGPATVRDIFENYGTANGLGRSTILTMLERLREKKRLKRSRVDGVFQYATAVPVAELLRGVVRNFVDTALDGSFSPFVSYLAETPDMSDEELAELERAVARLQKRRKKGA